MVDMTFCGNCICIDYILCNISIIDWKKICWWCSHILWRPWPRFKIKNLSEKMSTCFCLMACHARNGWVLQWLPFGQSELIYLFFCYTSSQWPLLLDTELVIGTCFFILNLRTKSKLPTCKKDFALVKGKSFIHSIHVLLLVCSPSRLID